MPYIKPKDRPKWDPIIELVGKFQIPEAVKATYHLLLDIQEKKITGQLNYLFTQCFRKCDILKVDLFIRTLFEETFWADKSYYKFELVSGLMNCMIREWVRRGWKNWKIVTFSLRGILNYNEELLNKYEDLKIEQNGDLD